MLRLTWGRLSIGNILPQSAAGTDGQKGNRGGTSEVVSYLSSRGLNHVDGVLAW